MNLTISDRGNVLNQHSRELTERRLMFALSRFESRIHEVDFIISDENGPRGGIDKVGRITISLRGAQDVVLTHKDDDVSRCVSRLADRAGRAVARSLSKSNQINRSKLELVEAE